MKFIDENGNKIDDLSHLEPIVHYLEYNGKKAPITSITYRAGLECRGEITIRWREV